MENDINTRLSAVESTLAGFVKTANENTDRLVSAVNDSSKAQQKAILHMATAMEDMRSGIKAISEPDHLERMRCGAAFEAFKAWLPKMTADYPRQLGLCWEVADEFVRRMERPPVEPKGDCPAKKGAERDDELQERIMHPATRELLHSLMTPEERGSDIHSIPWGKIAG